MKQITYRRTLTAVISQEVTILVQDEDVPANLEEFDTTELDEFAQSCIEGGDIIEWEDETLDVVDADPWELLRAPSVPATVSIPVKS